MKHHFAYVPKPSSKRFWNASGQGQPPPPHFVVSRARADSLIRARYQPLAPQYPLRPAALTRETCFVAAASINALHPSRPSTDASKQRSLSLIAIRLAGDGRLEQASENKETYNSCYRAEGSSSFIRTLMPSGLDPTAS